MKKILFLAAAASMALVACNKNAFTSQFDGGKNGISTNDISVSAVSSSTKGYVEGAVFYDTAYDKLHVNADSVSKNPVTPREMLLSAYLNPQEGEPANYFVGEKFSINANGETDSLWHHNPKIYWPIGGDLSFLAISSTIPFTGTAIKWADNAAQKVVLDVSEEYKQDDIIYAAKAAGKVGAMGSAKGNVALTFDHTQAWIQFQLKVADTSMVDIIKIKDITFEDVYTRGELTLNGGSAQSFSWNFDKETRANCVMDDTYGVTAASNFLNEKVQFMDMLLPQQGQKAFVIRYTLEGQPDKVLEYRYALSGGQWLAGKKYIYAINISLYEITVTPSVTAFEDADMSGDGFPSDIQ